MNEIRASAEDVNEKQHWQKQEEGKETVGVVGLREQRASFMFVRIRSVSESGPG